MVSAAANRQNKYRAQRTTVDGVTYASKKEAKRASELQLLELAGEITDLTPQPSYVLWAWNENNPSNAVSVGKYTPDFRYYVNGRIVVEDVKGGNATKTEAYRLRKRIFQANYPNIEHREV